MPVPPDYPAGEFIRPVEFTAAVIQELVARFRRIPFRVHAAVVELEEADLEVRYRNWTVRQIVHHLADSHLNCLMRIKAALTEDEPTIKPYDESRWAETADAKHWPLIDSMAILAGMHARLCGLFESLSPAQFARTYRHPQFGTIVRIDEALAQYVWHGEHHLAQIEWVRAHRLSRAPADLQA